MAVDVCEPRKIPRLCKRSTDTVQQETTTHGNRKDMPQSGFLQELAAFLPRYLSLREILRDLRGYELNHLRHLKPNLAE
jgi:hypothetical protein